MDKVSSIIKDSCCGQGLPIGCSQFKLAAMVSDLEEEVVRLKNELEALYAYSDSADEEHFDEVSVILTNINNTNKRVQ